jgi:hypothetical protein
VRRPWTKNRGLLSLIQTVERRKAGPLGPEPSAARLGPWGFSTGVVVSLEEGFVLKLISELNALLDRFALICLSSCYEKITSHIQASQIKHIKSGYQ